MVVKPLRDEALSEGDRCSPRGAPMLSARRSGEIVERDTHMSGRVATSQCRNVKDRFWANISCAHVSHAHRS